MNMNKGQFSEEYLPQLKSAHTAPQMEDCPKDELLAFSLSPKCSHDVENDYIENLGIKQREPSIWAKKIMCELKDKIHYCDFVNIHVEASSKGRLHLHGWIIVKDVLNFYCQDMPRLQYIGTYCIKQIFNVEGAPHKLTSNQVWERYMEKQSSYWKPYFQKYPFSSPNSGKVLMYPFNLQCYYEDAERKQCLKSERRGDFE